MKTKDIFELFKEHQGKSLLFEYCSNELVKANYHITEVKHVRIDSVDCGAQIDNWNETVIQLWESPEELNKSQFMSVYKALSLLKKVGKLIPFDLDSEVKFEYGNATFHTTQLFVNNYETFENNLILKLGVEKTDCKAKNICGIQDNNVTETKKEMACNPSNSNCC